MVANSQGHVLRMLLDTNIVIAHEDDDPVDPDANADAAQELVGLARRLGFELMVSNGTRRDVLQAAPERRRARQRALNKYYTQLASVPDNPDVRAQFPAGLSPNNRADLEVVSTYAAKVATVLVTEDDQMRARAKRAGLSNVFSLQEAIEWLRALCEPRLENAMSAAYLPAVYQVDRGSAFFDSLKSDYDDFDSWWDKVVDERRHVIVLGETADPMGLAVLKAEADEFDLGPRVLKICTFKVDDGAGQSRRGELLLRAVVDYAVNRAFPVAYMTVWPRHTKLLGWLRRFGFFEAATAEDGQLVMAKRFSPRQDEPVLAPLEHQVRYGPRSMRVTNAFVIPIQDRYHQRLFPDSEDQLSMLENEACGNAIRKAYLCHGSSRQLTPGDTVLFLRTKPRQEARVTSVGVVEKTLASDRPDEIAAFVAGRTVYSYAEIIEQCAAGEVLAILFRLDRRIEPPWMRRELIKAQVMKDSPMSVQSVPQEGTAWVRARLSPP